MAALPPERTAKQLLSEIHSAALTLKESADHLSKLTRLVRPELSNCQFIVRQAYLKIRDLANLFEIEL